jgi:hypothetical protein
VAADRQGRAGRYRALVGRRLVDGRRDGRPTRRYCQPAHRAPGAALLYAVAAVLLWPSRRQPEAASTPEQAVAAASPLSKRGSSLLWLVLWGGSACLLMSPAARAPRALSSAVEGLAGGEPDWLASTDHLIAGLADHDAALISGLLALAFGVIAAGIVLPRTTRPVLVLACGIALVIWVLGENFGGLLTGQATDPNTGPLLILLTAAFWPPRRLPPTQPDSRRHHTPQAAPGRRTRAAGGHPATAIHTDRPAAQAVAGSPLMKARSGAVTGNSRTITSPRSCQPSAHHRWHTRRPANYAPFWNPTGVEREPGAPPGCLNGGRTSRTAGTARTGW